MFEKTCCVTGHRNIQEERSSYVEQELRREVLAAIQDGYTRFISGFAEGADLMFAAIVAEQMEHVMTLKVPLLAEAKIGESWYAAK